MVSLPQGAIDALSSSSGGDDSSSSINLPQGAMDALSAPSDSGGSFSDMFKSTESAMNQASPASSFLTSFGQGVAQSGEGLVNLVLKLAGDKSGLSKVSGKEKTQDQFFNEINPDDAPSDSVVSELIPSAKTLGNVAGQSAPYALGGEALSGSKVAEAFGLGGKAGSFWGKLLKRGGAGAAAGAAAYDPNNNQGQNAILGTSLSAVGFPAAATIGKYALNPVRFSGKLAGMLSKVTPERIKKAIDSGRHQLSGGVLNIPWLKKFETNTLPTAVFSNYAEKVQGVADDLGKQATDLYNKLTNGVTGNANRQVRDILSQESKELNGENVQNYKKWNDLSGKDQLTYNRYFDKSEDLSDSRSAAFKAGGLTDEGGLLSKLNQIVSTGKHTKDLEEISKLSETDPEAAKQKIEDLKLSGKSTELPDRSLKTTNFLRSTLGNFQAEANIKGDRNGAQVWGELKDALDDDIGEYLDAPGNEDIKDAYDYSQQFYKDNIAPIRDAKLQKYTKGLDDTDTLISHYFVRNQDRPEKLQKLLKAAPNAEGYVMKHALKPAVQKDIISGKETVNPGTLSKILSDKGIGYDRLQALTKQDPEKLQAIQDYQESYETNKDSLKSLENTFTGFQNIADQNVKSALEAFASLASSGGMGSLKDAAKKHMSTFFMAPASAILKNPQFLRYALEHKMNPNAQTTANLQGWALGFASAMISQLAQAEDQS